MSLLGELSAAANCCRCLAIKRFALAKEHADDETPADDDDVVVVVVDLGAGVVVVVVKSANDVANDNNANDDDDDVPLLTKSPPPLISLDLSPVAAKLSEAEDDDEGSKETRWKLSQPIWFSDTTRRIVLLQQAPLVYVSCAST